MATAAFRDIRRAFPESQITLLLKPGRERVVSGGAYFDRALCDRSSGSLPGVLKMAGELRRQRFDLAILFADSFRARLLATLAGIPRRVGYRRNLGGPLLTDAVRYPGERGVKTPEPMPIRFSRLLSALDIADGDKRPQLTVRPEEEERLDKRRQKLGIQKGERLVGLNPGASFGASKIWPPRHFARLVDLLAEKYAVRAVLLVGPGEDAIARAISESSRHPLISTAHDLILLDELKPFIRDLALLVTTDSGPRHYAVAFRVPTVVLMGPTDRRYTDIHLDETIVLRHDLPCSPCHLKVCPIDHRCMRGITPEEVMETIAELDRKVGVFRSHHEEHEEHEGSSERIS